MTITITQEHNEARLNGTRSFLDAGVDPARVRLYGGTRPANASADPGSPMLVEIPLTKPCGTVAGGVLTLTQASDGLVLQTGVVTWARFVNGNGVTAFDCDAGEGVGTWEVQLAQAQLYAGGGARIISAVMG